MSDGVVYSYSVPSGGYAGNGNILSQSDSVMGDWNFGYDSLSRLTSGTAANGTYAGQWGCWGYDSYGNRTMQVVGSQPCNVATPTATYNARNQVSFVSQQSPSPVSAANGFTYDAGGNVINDGLNQYAYDAEGRLCAVEVTLTHSMTAYVYDAGGNRVAKGSVTALSCNNSSNGFTLKNQYLVGAGGEQVTELNGTAVWQHSNVWSGTGLTATYDPKGLHLHVTDPLGTRRVQLNAQGAVEGTCQNLPFGDALTCTPTALSTADDATEHHFTSKEYDAESGNDYFLARYYGSNMGRFMSPDWAGHPEAVPYSSLKNPQTLNLYAYVGNNPMTGVDPDGHAPLDCTGSNASGIGCQTIAQWNTQHEVSASAWASSGFGNVNVSYQNGNYTVQHSWTPTANQNTDYASVSYWPKSAGGFGHIGIGVDTDDTQGYSTLDPKAPWYERLFGAPMGNPEDDLDHHTSPSGEVAPHSYLHIPITADQAAAMREAMDARTADPGHYNLIFNNCAQFVESVLHAGGVSGVPHAEVFGPAILGGLLWLEH